jgi:archaellum component FlaC
MKKFTILMGLFLATVITGSAFAQPVTFTPEQIKKIEDHIIGLNTQIEELTAENKSLKAEIAEANKNADAPSDNAEGVVDSLINSEDFNVVKEEPSNISCKQVGEIAENIMKIRQAGTPMSSAMDIADGNSVVIAMVQVAYEITRWSTDQNKLEAMQDFRIKNEQLCYKTGFEER